MGDRGWDPMGMQRAGGCSSDPAACLLPACCLREGPVLGITLAASIPGAVSPWVLLPPSDRPPPGLGGLSHCQLQY